MNRILFMRFGNVAFVLAKNPQIEFRHTGQFLTGAKRISHLVIGALLECVPSGTPESGMSGTRRFGVIWSSD